MVKTFDNYLKELGNKKAIFTIGNQGIEKEKEKPDREITHEVHPVDSKNAANLHKAMKASGFRAEKVENVHHKEHGDLQERTYSHSSGGPKITIHTKY